MSCIKTIKNEDEKLTKKITLRKTIVFNKKKKTLGFQQRYIKDNKIMKINYIEIKIDELQKMLEII